MLGIGGNRYLQSLQQGDSSHAVEQFLDENRVISSYCSPNCRGHCPLDVHVRDGQIRKVEPQVPDREEFRRACTLGQSHLERTYNPNRLKYPMVRSDWSPEEPNPEGRGPDADFEQVSWDEALDYVADGMERIREEYAPESVYFELGSGGSGINGTVFSRLANLFGGTMMSWSIDINLGLGFRRITGAGYFNTPTNMRTDLKNANTVVIWGGNVFRSRLNPDARFLLDAIENGAKVVVIDPVYNQTAAKADLWLPVKPGKDVYLALAMIHTVLEEELADEAFLRERTLAPALVREDTGELLKTSDVFDDGDDETPVALDEETGEPVPLEPETHGEYALFGEYEVDGYDVATGLSEIEAVAAEYAPGAIEDTAGVKAENVRRTARWLATRGPGGIMTGLGIDRYKYGHIFGQAYAILLALTGDYGRSGSITGGRFAGSGYNSDYGTVEGSSGVRSLQQKGILSAMEGDDEHPIKMMYAQSSNFVANQMPDRTRWLEALENLDLVAVADIHHTPTVQHADIVLPASHWTEREDITSAGEHPHVMYREPAHEPLWDSKSDHWMLTRIAERLGYGEHFERDRTELLRTILEAEDRFTFEELREKGTVHVETDEVVFTDEFNTSTGRLEIYDEDAPSEKGVSLEVPKPVEGLSADDHEQADEYPLMFMQGHSRWRIHSQWAGNPTLRELNPEPELDINPKDARERGISDGDYVRVYNDRGEMVVKAKYNDAYRPGMVNTDQGWWADDYVAGHHNNLTHTEVSETIENFAFYDTRVEVEPVSADVDTSQYDDPESPDWLEELPTGGDAQ
ncbi:dimethylsulfoxide reductase [Halobiforma lacisalsi AJ5]|uniref:Dimethylsulfoxide reductase n=1 Tax=Natronobacterium lacisalsi AJ5 TaxID=358396 RepID=M0LW85_NATLA|nr:dimethylsulfoxide reductase [Halobiforma lacisalsi AJ5]